MPNPFVEAIKHELDKPDDYENYISWCIFMTERQIMRDDAFQPEIRGHISAVVASQMHKKEFPDLWNL